MQTQLQSQGGPGDPRKPNVQVTDARIDSPRIGCNSPSQRPLKVRIGGWIANLFSWYQY
jgi:hypothetical protein